MPPSPEIHTTQPGTRGEQTTVLAVLLLLTYSLCLDFGRGDHQIGRDAFHNVKFTESLKQWLGLLFTLTSERTWPPKF